MEASLPRLILPIKLEKSEERPTSWGGGVVLEEWARAAGGWVLQIKVDLEKGRLLESARRGCAALGG